MGIMAQTNLRGWHEFGQTWLVWEDTEPIPETYRIYKASSQIIDVSSAEQIGRVFEGDWAGNRLKLLDDGLKWTIPDGSGGTYTLESNEALFVYTPHETESEYFAVVKDGETVVESNNRIGPISQMIDAVQCHLQSSGSDDGFTYRVYAHWIDGRDDWNSGRFDYPVMGNEHFNGTGRLFRVWEPQGGVTSEVMPAVIALHGGGGWYGSITPGSDGIYDLSLSDAFVICLDDKVHIKKANGIGYQKTYWLGYWEGYDRFSLSSEQSVPDDGLVVNYTMRRINWELDWLIDHESIDPRRVSLLGGSMGGRGANYLARAYPERYAAWLTLSTGLVTPDDDPLMGSPSQNVSTNLPGSPRVLDVMGLTTVLSGTERDIPFGKIVAGRADPSLAKWTIDIIQMFETVNENGWGTHLYWDDRGHVYSHDSFWAGSYRLKAKALTAYRSDQSFPAFFNDDQDTDTPGRQPDMGNGDPSDGDIWGTWSGFYSWDTETIVDSPNQWEATVFLISSGANANDVPSFANSQTDISIRRPQQFTPSSGNTVGWKLTLLSDPQIMQTGQEIVGENGVVTIPNLTIGKDKCRLTVSIVTTSVSAPDDELGIPTEFAISQNHPNPFNPITTISYQLPQSGHVHLAVYNISGQLVETLVSKHKNAGYHSVIWNATGISSGLYLYRVTTEQVVEVRKCIVLK
jgi:poly(3-hydroxybutyrate) depolymerase